MSEGMGMANVDCSRCCQLTDAQISALLSTDIQVGQVHLTRLGQILPAVLDHALPRLEREILVALLTQHPNVVEYVEFPLIFPSDTGKRLLLNQHISNLRPKLAPYFVNIVRQHKRGFRLVEVQA